MPRPHYHRCSECPASVLCTKQGDHDEPTCIKCRLTERDRCQTAPFQVMPARFMGAEDWAPIDSVAACVEYIKARYAGPWPSV